MDTEELYTGTTIRLSPFLRITVLWRLLPGTASVSCNAFRNDILLVMNCKLANTISEWKRAPKNRMQNYMTSWQWNEKSSSVKWNHRAYEWKVLQPKPCVCDNMHAGGWVGGFMCRIYVYSESTGNASINRVGDGQTLTRYSSNLGMWNTDMLCRGIIYSRHRLHHRQTDRPTDRTTTIITVTNIIVIVRGRPRQPPGEVAASIGGEKRPLKPVMCFIIRMSRLTFFAANPPPIIILILMLVCTFSKAVQSILFIPYPLLAFNVITSWNSCIFIDCQPKCWCL